MECADNVRWRLFKKSNTILLKYHEYLNKPGTASVIAPHSVQKMQRDTCKIFNCTLPKISGAIPTKLENCLSPTSRDPFLGVGKNAIVSFFSPDLFMKNSNFSKTVRTIFIKFCSHSTPKGAPACSKASKSYDWNVRNIAKISLKMAKISPKTAIFQLFFDFCKNCQYDSNENFFSHFLHHSMVYVCNFNKFV